MIPYRVPDNKEKSRSRTSGISFWLGLSPVTVVKPRANDMYHNTCCNRNQKWNYNIFHILCSLLSAAGLEVTTMVVYHIFS